MLRAVEKEGPFELSIEDEFEHIWWNEWHPARRVAKKPSLEEYKKARRRADYETILNGVRASVKYWNDMGTEPQFIPHFRKWLKDDLWTNEYPEVKPVWSHKEQKYVRQEQWK